MLTSLAIVMLASVALQVLLVAATAAWRPAGNIYVTIVIVCLITAPLALIADRLLLGQDFGRDARVFLVLIHLALGRVLLSFHDAARSIGDAADPGGAAGRSRSGA